MTMFGNYSCYYNLLYQDKDYQGEIDFIHGLIQQHAPDASNVLDLGCGTGRHDILLADKGYTMTGVDMSAEMIAVAKQSGGNNRNNVPPVFHKGDLRSFRLNEKFDVVISLFHVMSYQTTNDDFVSALHTARAHLKAGGIFIFDFWYGPAVLTDRPAVRVKQLEDELIEVIRTAEPAMQANKNLVNVNYTVWIKDKENLQTKEIRETHCMRYWFMPEIEYLIGQVGFDIRHTGEWMTGKAPGFDTWGVYAMVAAE